MLIYKRKKELSICNYNIFPLSEMKLIRLEKKAHFQESVLNFLFSITGNELQKWKPRDA